MKNRAAENYIAQIAKELSELQDWAAEIIQNVA